jgi:hypothetical protein
VVVYYVQKKTKLEKLYSNVPVAINLKRRKLKAIRLSFPFDIQNGTISLLLRKIKRERNARSAK